MNQHLNKAERWLLTCIRNGLANSFDVLTNKWCKPYPEVTGYLLSYFCSNNLFNQSIKNAGNKLLKIQAKNGGFYSIENKKILYTFDTGQILIGLLELYKITNISKYKEAAVKGGDFLINQQMDNGAFIPIYKKRSNIQIINQNTYSTWNGQYSGLMCKLTEAYNALYETTKDEKYLKHRNLTTAFYKNMPDIECTHPMGYFFEGLYAGGEIDLVKEKLKKNIVPRLRKNGYIPYKENLPYAYVSGTIQLGIILYKTGFLDEALKIRNYGRLVQSMHNSGGIFQYAGETGILDKNVHTEINSWGTKYFCELERLTENV